MQTKRKPKHRQRVELIYCDTARQTASNLMEFGRIKNRSPKKMETDRRTDFPHSSTLFGAQLLRRAQRKTHTPMSVNLSAPSPIGLILCVANLGYILSQISLASCNMDLPDGIENILGFVPKSTFRCERDGYFGDVDNDCRLFHLCQRQPSVSGRAEWRHWTYACGNQTMFNQLTLTCAFVDEAIPCKHANQFQYLNEVINRPSEPFLTDADVTSGFSYYSNRIMSDGARQRAFEDSQLLAQLRPPSSVQETFFSPSATNAEDQSSSPNDLMRAEDDRRHSSSRDSLHNSFDAQPAVASDQFPRTFETSLGGANRHSDTFSFSIATSHNNQAQTQAQSQVPDAFNQHFQTNLASQLSSFHSQLAAPPPPPAQPQSQPQQREQQPSIGTSTSTPPETTTRQFQLAPQTTTTTTAATTTTTTSTTTSQPTTTRMVSSQQSLGTPTTTATTTTITPSSTTTGPATSSATMGQQVRRGPSLAGPSNQTPQGQQMALANSNLGRTGRTEQANTRRPSAEQPSRSMGRRVRANGFQSTRLSALANQQRPEVARQHSAPRQSGDSGAVVMRRSGSVTRSSNANVGFTHQQESRNQQLGLATANSPNDFWRQPNALQFDAPRFESIILRRRV